MVSAAHWDGDEVLRRTETWLRRAVVGHGLCPFAHEPVEQGTVRIVVSDALAPQQLEADLARELELLRTEPPDRVETTLLVHPGCLLDFDDYNQFLDVADEIVDELELWGVIQVASFHPNYQFADTDPDAAENFTNRSPYPTLHLLREASVTRVVDRLADPGAIPRRNIALLNGLPRQTLLGWRRGDPE